MQHHKTTHDANGKVVLDAQEMSSSYWRFFIKPCVSFRIFRAGHSLCSIALLFFGVAASGAEGTVDGRASESENRVQRIPPLPGMKESPVIAALTLNLSGEQVAVAGDDHSIRLIKQSSGAEEIVLRGHRGWIQCLEFSEAQQLLGAIKESLQLSSIILSRGIITSGKHVAPYALLATLDKRLDAIGFDFIFAVDAKLFTNFHFNRKSMRIPTCFAKAVVSAHGAVAWEEVLDCPSQAVTGVGHPVGGGWAFVKDKRRSTTSLFQSALINAVSFPKLQNTLLKVWKPDLCANRFKHGC